MDTVVQTDLISAPPHEAAGAAGAGNVDVSGYAM